MYEHPVVSIAQPRFLRLAAQTANHAVHLLRTQRQVPNTLAPFIVAALTYAGHEVMRVVYAEVDSLYHGEMPDTTSNDCVVGASLRDGYAVNVRQNVNDCLLTVDETGTGRTVRIGYKVGV